MTARSRVGVTFWQILAALAITAFVGAVIFPVFQKVHENVRNPRTGCSSNLRQLGLAYTQYSQDANEVFPSGLNAAGNGWAGQIYPYCKSVWLYQCPSDPSKGKYISYAQNRNMTGRPIDRFGNPAASVALYETTTLNCDPSTAEAVSGVGLAAPQDSDRHDPQNHSLNFLAVDGHVYFLPPSQISFGPNATPPKTIQNQVGKPISLTFAVK